MSTAAYCPLSVQTIFDTNGYPIVGARLFFYDAETTNPRTVFTTAAMTTAQPTPLLTDGFGRVPVTYVGVGSYKVVIQDAQGAMITTIDDLPGGTDDPVSPVTGTTIPTGFVMPAHTADIVDGWLPLNGKTIGNATSPATARADPDTQTLYVKLYNNDHGLAVLGGRGVSASADFAAGKTLALPDYRGRAVAGVDGMGNEAAGILTGATVSGPDQVGSRGGQQLVTLDQSQLPPVSPAITVNAAGGHTHTGTTDTSGAHTHVGTVDANGDHTHNYFRQNGGVPYNGTGVSPTPADATATPNATSVAGAHQHTFTVGGGTHNHSLVVNAVGDHAHTASIAALGSGAPHSNLSPVVLAYWHIKL